MSSSGASSPAVASPPPLVTESRTPFTFQLNHIQLLDSSANDLSWRKQVSIYLHVMDIYKYVDASTPKTTATIHLAKWTSNDYTANAASLSFLCEDLIYLVPDAPTGKDACKAVEEHRDVRNSSTLQQRVQSFFSTKIQDTDVLRDHISSYDQKYTYVTARCL